MVIALNRVQKEIPQHVQHMLWNLQVACCVANQQHYTTTAKKIL